jgi:hypothetical protein
LIITQDLHWCLTLGAFKDRPDARRAGLYQNLQNQLNQGQQLLGVAMQKAIISGSTKAFGQNMLQYQPQEVFTFDGAAAGLAGTAFDVFEGDVAILIRHDIAFTDDAPVQVPRQVF